MMSSSDYPWTHEPLIVGAPMRLIATAPLAVAISQAGGLGFIGAGTDVSTLAEQLRKASSLLEQHESTIKSTYPVSGAVKSERPLLPVGVGVICWGASLAEIVAVLESHRSIPAALWLFAPEHVDDLKSWCEELRRATSNASKIWIQVGSIAEVTTLCSDPITTPDVLVVQGVDAGGHGLNRGSSLISLLPEVSDVLEEFAASGKTVRKPLI